MICLFEKIFPNYLWRVQTKRKVLYLTFDDGPVPEVTPWVLSQLALYNAKATFFCVGDNLRKFPKLLKQIIDQGHVIGNHTFNHLNGWHTDFESYIDNFKESERYSTTSLFRPPYGRITSKQAKRILSTHKIVMWSVLTKDYSSQISPELCFKRSIQNTKSGDIILFHDSIKAKGNLFFTLPKFLSYFHQKGYVFEAL